MAEMMVLEQLLCLSNFSMAWSLAMLTVIQLAEYSSRLRRSHDMASGSYFDEISVMARP
jgi:hypothetical protein